MFCTCHSVRIQNADWIVRALSGLPVLTVGEIDGFLESGGIINFIMEDEKVRFEINNTSARESELEIRSKLLRLAKRVIDEQVSKEEEN